MSDAPLFPSLLELSDPALFLLRVWVALLFGWSGWSHLTEPRERGRSIGVSPAATAMLGAIAKKAFVWKTGFWGKESSQGWYYEVLYLLCNLVILATGGGSIGL